MQISATSTKLYEGLGSTKSRELSSPENSAVPSSGEDKLSLSPEAMKGLEKLAAYPGWAGDYLPQVNVLNNPDANKIGYAAWEMEYRDTHKSELQEYERTFTRFYEETKIEHGILTADDHYEKVISAEDGNLAFQQTFESKLRGDPRMLELMGILGVKQAV